MQDMLLDLRRFQRGATDLTLISLFGILNFICAVGGTSFYMLFAPCLPTLFFYGGRWLSETFGMPWLLTAGIFLSLCMLALWALLRIRVRGRYRVMLAATLLYAADTVCLVVFSLSTGFVTGLADAFLHLLFLIPLFRAVLAGRRIERMPALTPELLEATLRPLVLPPEGTPLGTPIGDAPPDEADTPPLRPEVRRKRYFFKKQIFGLTVHVARARGVTELCVNGQVYAEIRGIVEFAYSLSATVEGHRITVRLSPGGMYGRMILLVDGRLAAECRRYL